MPRTQEVLIYLDAHRDLAEVLPSPCRKVRLALSGDVKLSLEAYLSLHARQAVYSPDLLDRIEAASEGFDGLLRDGSGWLLLTTDYRRLS